jgi:hypothetical protein
MTMIKPQWPDLKAIDRKLRKFETMAKSAKARAMNRALTTVKKEGKFKFEAALGMKIRKDDWDRRHTIKKASKDDLNGMLRLKPKRMSLYTWRPKEKIVKVKPKENRWGATRKGVTIKTKKGRQLTRGFLIPGKKPVFVRRDDSDYTSDVIARTSNLPQKVFHSEEYKEHLKKIMNDAFKKNLISEMNYQMSRLK